MDDYSDEFKQILEAYELAGGSANILDEGIGSIIIDSHKVLEKTEIKGLHIKYKIIKNGINVKIFVDDKAEILEPVHLCVGMLQKKGTQKIISEFFIGKNSKVNFLAHCSFPNSEKITHIMDSKVHLAKNAEMSYIEEHYHSDKGAFVYPKLRADLEEGAKLKEEFKLIKGRVGLLKIDYEVKQEKKSECELLTKVYGKKTDKIEVRESIHLNGAYASGIAKSRIVLKDKSFGNVLGEVEGNAPNSRGHIDCYEVVQGEKARAVSTPKISVKDSRSRVTHEAAIGRINKKELETLMARGLTEEEAVDLIVNGILD